MDHSVSQLGGQLSGHQVRTALVRWARDMTLYIIWNATVCPASP